jgi:hypothetical protein
MDWGLGKFTEVEDTLHPLEPDWRMTMKVKDYLECCCRGRVEQFFVTRCDLNDPEEVIGVLGYDDVMDLSNPSISSEKGETPIRFVATAPVDISSYGRNAEVLPMLFKDGERFAYVDLGDIRHAWKVCVEKENGQFYSYIDGNWVEVDEIW